MSGTSPQRWLLPAGIGVLIAVLVVVALVRDPIVLDPSTPEGTVQEYLQAISDNDYETAVGILHPEEFEGCGPADLARFGPEQPFTASLETDEPSADGERARVSVRIRFGTDGLFNSGGETWESFELVSEDGIWWIAGEPWPHFFWECQDRENF